MTKDQIVTRVKEAGAIAILRKMPATKVLAVADAVIAGGITAVEVTLDSEGAIQAIQYLRGRYGDQILIGAGTIMTTEQVRDAVEAGADVLLSPHFDAALVKAALELGKPMIPGIMTATEVMQAERAGAEVFKLFPAGPLGPSYLKDLLGPFAGKSFVPTGGITVDNAADYIRAGAVAVGMGSSLVPKKDIDAEDWQAITDRSRQFMETIQSAKR